MSGYFANQAGELWRQVPSQPTQENGGYPEVVSRKKVGNTGALLSPQGRLETWNTNPRSWEPHVGFPEDKNKLRGAHYRGAFYI